MGFDKYLSYHEFPPKLDGELFLDGCKKFHAAGQLHVEVGGAWARHLKKLGRLRELLHLDPFALRKVLGGEQKNFNMWRKRGDFF